MNQQDREEAERKRKEGIAVMMDVKKEKVEKEKKDAVEGEDTD